MHERDWREDLIADFIKRTSKPRIAPLVPYLGAHYISGYAVAAKLIGYEVEYISLAKKPFLKVNPQLHPNSDDELIAKIAGLIASDLLKHAELDLADCRVQHATRKATSLVDTNRETIRCLAKVVLGEGTLEGMRLNQLLLVSA
jgi:hypothetical protein